MGTQTTSISTSTTNAEDRSELIKEAVGLTIQAAYGLQKMNEQHISQMLGNLVRTKLLTADDSYRLRDRLLDAEAAERILDQKIEFFLRARGAIA